ncbi:GerMN domain-containing protein [bacterium]|nr:GerMN domain-containing protein [bacterium]
MFGLGTSPKISLVAILSLTIFLLVIIIFIITYLFSGPERDSMFDSITDQLTGKSELYLGGKVSPSTAPMVKKTIRLYFLGEDEQSLVVEERNVLPQNEINAEIRVALIELFWGSKKGYKTAIPDQTRLREVFTDQSQTVYIDLSHEIVDNHPGGVLDEVLTLMAIIRTIQENFPQITHVQILVDGNEIETLAGHILINRPLTGTEFQKIF